MFFTKLFGLTYSDVFPTRAALYLNDWELLPLTLTLLAGVSSLLNYHKLLCVSEELPLYSIKLYIGIVI